MVGCTRIAAALLIVLGASACASASGDKGCIRTMEEFCILYVQKDGVKVQAGPGTDTQVLTSLPRGANVVEYARLGDWINIGPWLTSAQDGWVRTSLVGPRPGEPTTVPDPRFAAFRREMEELRRKVEPASGFPFFVKVENLGDGFVQVMAHPRWLDDPAADRTTDLHALFQLWSAHGGGGRSIALYVVDSTEKVVMMKARSKGGLTRWGGPTQPR